MGRRRWGGIGRGSIAVRVDVKSVDGLYVGMCVCVREEVYQIIDCGCADVVDDVDEKLEREDDEEEGWHGWDCDE